MATKKVDAPEAGQVPASGPTERATPESGNDAAAAAQYVENMRQRHPAAQGEQAEKQWTVQRRGDDGLYRDIVSTDDAHHANRIFNSDPAHRVIDNKLKDYAADHVPYYKGHDIKEGQKPSHWEAEYHARSSFREAVELPEREPNVITMGRERVRTADEIDVEEALKAAGKLREADRRTIEAQRDHVVNLEQHAKRQDRGNDLDELAGRAPDFGSQTMTEHEKNRRIELVQQLHQQFKVNGSEFRFKDQPAKIAFRDIGDALKSASNDERVVGAMATLAEAKGWKTISVSGHPDFKREAWLAHALRGIEVKGYKPQEEDLKRLAELRDRQQRNAIEHVPERAGAEKDRSAEHVSIGSPRGNSAVKGDEARSFPPGHKATGAPQERQTPAPARIEPEQADRQPRAITGVLVAHGAAPYRDDPKENPSYYVKVATPKGDRTVWGLDLERSLATSGVKQGEAITVAFEGNKAVTVEGAKRDAAGKVIGREAIDTHRNTWSVSPAPESDRSKIVKAVAEAVLANKVKDPAAREVVMKAIADRVHREDQAGKLPPVQVYDHTAPMKSRGGERVRPQVERNTERTR